MIALASGFNDPKIGLKWLSDKRVPDLLKIFDAIYVIATPHTKKTTIEKLKKQGINVTQQKNDSVGLNYYSAIKTAFDSGADTIFFCDFDRILYWVDNFPEELRRAVKLAKTKDYLVNERTPEGYKNHHQALFFTEQLPNELISAAVNSSHVHDYLSGSWSFSKRAAKIIVEKGREESFAFIGMWPFLLKMHDIDPAYKQWKGLNWETPNQFQKEVKAAGGVDKFRKKFSTPDEWAKRTRNAFIYVAGIVPYLHVHHGGHHDETNSDEQTH